jgi:hypothetical protein
MSRAKPIWNEVTACIYGSSKSFGAKDTSKIKTFVGSSSSNSCQLSETIITKRFQEHEKYGNIIVFKHSVDGIILKEIIFKDNKGKAGKFIKERSAMKRLKGLS